MIYKKDASFPYPILSNTSNNYQDNEFSFDILSLIENEESYSFTFDYKISSPFINQLIEDQKACLIFIIQSKDNLFQKLTTNQNELSISKNRLSLTARTTIQLHVQSLEEIEFNECGDLSVFYDALKSDLKINKHTLLGYSNLVVYEGSENKPLQIFERKVDPKMSSSFKVELGPSTIVLVFKDEKYQLNGIVRNNALMNMYIYEGLSRALNKFIQDNLNDEEFIDLPSLGELQDNILNQKLLDLMLNKGIEEIDPDSIDEIISKISDNIVEKFVYSVREVSNYGD